MGDIITQSLKNFNYLSVLKNNLNFQKKDKNKDFYLYAISKEFAISDVKDYNKIKNFENELANNKTEENIQNEVKINNGDITVNQIDNEKNNNEQINNEEINKNNNKEINYPVETKIIGENNLSENYNTIYNNVKIKNETKFSLSEEILTPNVNFTDKKDIIIFHTHTCESYTATKENSYKPSGNYRTTDLNYSVAKVGSVLTDSLTQKGFNVIHDLTYHDYPAYNGSYTRSFKTVTNLLNKAPGTELVIDLHRDAIGNMDNYSPSVKIGDEVVAQLMFVIGTNGGGLEHPNWKTNFKFAIKIQEKANEMYPGLFRPIILRNSRYNQNLANSACIIEVGATGNTLEQTTGSMKYLSDVISKVMEN